MKIKQRPPDYESDALIKMYKIIPYFKKAEAQPGYKLLVEFEDGVAGIIELIKWKGKGVFEFWNEEKK